MNETTLRASLREVLADEQVITDEALLVKYSEDYTEEPGRRPGVIVQPRSVADVQGIVRKANELRAPITVRVAGSNVGGLTIPEVGGIVVDLHQMNRILDVAVDDMYALIEPGVTWEQLKAHLAAEQIPLRMGYPLSPPDTSVIANCLLDGLGNFSLRHGSMGDWVAGLEAVLPTGELIRTGAGALSDVWFGRAPLPDLTGLFLSFQGTTGIVTKLAFQLWPMPPHRRRTFVLTYDRAGAFRAMRDLARLEICDDVGGLSWTTGKMLFGVSGRLARDPSEPEFFLYIDLSGQSEAELYQRSEQLGSYLIGLEREGVALEQPLEVATLVRLNPEFGKFADFPTRLEFLVDHPGGGLSWVGTYGPLSRFEAYADAGVAALEKHGFPPTIVSRPMKGGHFGVMRFITLFNRADAAERQRVRAVNIELVDAGLELGFIPYKTAPWAVDRLKGRLDPGFAATLNKVRAALDPNGIMAPHCWKV